MLNKKSKNILIMTSIIILCFITSYLFNKYNKHDNNIIMKQTVDGYQVELYNNYGKQILSQIYPQEPSINELTKDIIELTISTGSPSSYSFYFNKETSEISKTYFNPIIWGNGNIAYMDDDTLILTDIFEKGLIYKEISRNFTETANPIASIISIEPVDDSNINLKYYSGDNYSEKTELINISV